MKIFKVLLLGCIITFVSCGQIARSVIEESLSDLHPTTVETYRAENWIAEDTFNVIQKKVIGTDSFSLLQSYYLNGKKFYESWQCKGFANGNTTFFYPSGKVRYIVFYKNGYAYSMVSSFNKKGEKIDGGTLKNKTGTLKLYNPFTDNLMCEVEYKNGLRTGTYKAYFKGGELGEQANYINDTVVGEYYKYYITGQIFIKGTVDIGINNSTVESYFTNGKPLSLSTFKNGTEIKYIEYDEKGLIIKQKKGADEKTISIDYYYGNDGKLLSKGESCEDKRHGTTEYYYSSGKTKTKETYSNDTILTETIWHENGKLSVENIFKGGLKNGICKEYYNTGNIRVEQMYVNGVEEGLYKSYFNNGKVYNEGRFKEGNLTGDLTFYTAKGTFDHITKYN